MITTTFMHLCRICAKALNGLSPHERQGKNRDSAISGGLTRAD